MNVQLRGRASYRLTGSHSDCHNTTPNTITIKEEVPCIDLDDDHHQYHHKPTPSRCVDAEMASESIDVITIDSDDDITVDEDMTVDDDIAVLDVIDSGFDSTSTSSASSSSTADLIVERPQNCSHCQKRLIRKSSLEYNDLTSADFYHNPRIHSSVISVELKDRNRLNSFHETILENKESFENKTVLIIGSCNGVLALFAAKAKAKTVIVCDGPGISEIIEAVIARNRHKLSANRTKFYVIREEFDDMVLPNGIDKVDVIVSDCVNHSLFYKSTFHHLIKARDKWLRKDGLIFPDSAHLWLVGAHDSIHKHNRKDMRYSTSVYVKKIDYWDRNLYDFDMTAIKKTVLSEPFHEYITNSQIITNECLVKRFDFNKMTRNDMNFTSTFNLNVIKDHYLQSFVLLFDVIFSKSRTVPRMYSTRPTADKNLFRPTIFFIESDKQLTVYQNDRIKGKFKYALNSDLNDMAVDITFKFKNKVCDYRKELLTFKTL